MELRNGYTVVVLNQFLKNWTPCKQNMNKALPSMKLPCISLFSSFCDVLLDTRQLQIPIWHVRTRRDLFKNPKKEVQLSSMRSSNLIKAVGYLTQSTFSCWCNSVSWQQNFGMKKSVLFVGLVQFSTSFYLVFRQFQTLLQLYFLGCNFMTIGFYMLLTRSERLRNLAFPRVLPAEGRGKSFTRHPL